VTISRVAATVSYPARVTLLCSMKPCPCSYAGARRRDCRCTGGQIERYQGRISGPLLDRMDLFVDVPRLTRQEPCEERGAEESRLVRERVSEAREIQATRQSSPNSALSGRCCARCARSVAMPRHSSRGRWTGWGSRKEDMTGYSGWQEPSPTSRAKRR
jgi:predicted ATPase with chaperone activity